MRGGVAQFEDVIQPLEDPAKDNMAAVQPARDDGRDEELGSIGVRAGIRHREETRLRVFEGKVLVLELGPVAVMSLISLEGRSARQPRHTWTLHRCRQSW